MIKECEICINSFPIDCFEFLPCFHKLCVFCYNDIKKSNIIFKCPFCRIEINNNNISSSNHNNFINNIQNEKEDYDEYYNNYNEEYYINKISKKYKKKHKRLNYSEKFNTS